MLDNLPIFSFGGLQLGGYGVGVVDEKEITRAAHNAITCGLKMFDTAPIYGLGHSEELLGKILNGKRNEVSIIDRIGLRWHKSDIFIKVIDNSPQHLTSQVENSLKILGTDYIDICLLHYPDIHVPISDTVGALLKLIEQGKIGNIGYSNIKGGLLREYLKVYSDVVVECAFNLINRDAGYELLPFCNNHHIPVIAHSPLGEGFLTGKYDLNSTFKDKDRRNNPLDRYFGKEYIKSNMAILERVKEIASKYGHEPAQVALSWLLHNRDVSTISVGIKTVGQLKDNLSAMRIKLSIGDILYLEGEDVKHTAI